MSDNVRAIAPAAKIDHAANIAAGLEQVAAEIRAGSFKFNPDLCVCVVACRSGRFDDFAMAFHGADSSTAELVGLLELAKLAAAAPE